MDETNSQAGEGEEAVSFTVVYFAGRVLRHIGGVLLLCWRRMALSAVIVGGVGLLLAEIAGSSITRHVPAPIPAQIVAALFAVGLAYGAALTALLAEIIVGALDTIRLLEGEAGAGARVAAVIDERAERELSGFVGWIDAGAIALVTTLTQRRSSTRRGISSQSTANQGPFPAPSQPTKPSEPRKTPQASPRIAALRPPLELQRPAPDANTHAQAANGELDTLNLETLAEIAATEEFINTAPRPKVNARPVRADQLPRIEWAYEQVERQQKNEDAPTASALVAPLERQISSSTPDNDETLPPSVPLLTPTEIVPATGESSRPPSPPTRPSVPPPVSSENLPVSSALITPPQAERVTAPISLESSGVHWTPPPPVPVLSPVATLRDASPRTTVPLTETSAEHNSIWARISRALAAPATHSAASLDQAHDDTATNANTPPSDTDNNA